MQMYRDKNENNLRVPPADRSFMTQTNEKGRTVRKCTQVECICRQHLKMEVDVHPDAAANIIWMCQWRNDMKQRERAGNQWKHLRVIYHPTIIYDGRTFEAPYSWVRHESHAYSVINFKLLFRPTISMAVADITKAAVGFGCEGSMVI